MKKIVLWTLSFFVFIYVLIKFINSNYKEVYAGDCDTTDELLLKELSAMVNNNIIDRNFYQVTSLPIHCNSRMVNYNLKYNLLSITEDDIFSGISVQYPLSKKDLNYIVSKRYSFSELRQKFNKNEVIMKIPQK